MPVQALGYLHSDEAIRTAYAAADVFVQASLEDNFPNTMLEAMSCGTPVVAFRVGGMPDVIVDGEEGRLVKAGDAKGLGEAILSLIGDPETLARMGHRARAKIEEQYTLEIQARRYAALFDEVLEGKPETGAEGEGSEGKAWSRPPGEGDGPVAVAPMEFRLGSRFERIHERVLLKTLGGYAVRSDKAFRSLEAEKKSWLEQIETLTRDLGSSERYAQGLERQLKTVTQQLSQSEEDRRTLAGSAGTDFRLPERGQ